MAKVYEGPTWIAMNKNLKPTFILAASIKEAVQLAPDDTVSITLNKVGQPMGDTKDVDKTIISELI